MNGFRNISTSWSDGAEDLASGPRGLSPPLAELGVQGLRCQPRSVCGASWTQAGSPVWQALQAPRGSDSPGGGLDRGQGGCVQRGPTTTQDGEKRARPCPTLPEPAGGAHVARSFPRTAPRPQATVPDGVWGPFLHSSAARCPRPWLPLTLCAPHPTAAGSPVAMSRPVCMGLDT